ncbi:MAG: nucleotidyltransferase domain-containing protein [Bacteroidetes bacterium]|nr:nucleotidyltransferase domain-containing protein [Bacteroidota bacterium]
MVYIIDVIPEICKICQTFHVRKLELFGSALQTNSKENNDIDFLIEFKEEAKQELFNNYFDIKFQLEKLLHKDVDVVMKSSLKNPYFIRGIGNTKTIYED